MTIDLLIGSSSAKVDAKGRLKIPTNFLRFIRERFGDDYFITSVEGDKATLFPLPVWEAFIGRLTSKLPSTSAAREKYLERVNYFGQLGTIDSQGRVLVPAVLREVASLDGEVVVLGNHDRLVIWNLERFRKRMVDRPITDDDMKELELHGV